MDVLFSLLEKYFFPIKENDFSNWGKINRGYDHLCTKLFYEEWSSSFQEYLIWKQVMMWSGTSNVVGDYIACSHPQQAM